MVDTTSNYFSFNWKIAGKAGEGVMVVAKIMAKICKRHGLNAFNYFEYPSLIKGGHQTGQVFASTGNATCQKRDLDLLITLDKNGFEEHKNEITENTLIIYNIDAEPLDKEHLECNSQKIVEIPLHSLSKETTGKALAVNMITLGASAYFLGLDTELIKQIIRDEFVDKGEEIVRTDLEAFDAGFSTAQGLGKPITKTPKSEDKNIVLTGNEAVGLGALASGLQFYSAYPMTPASGLLHYLAVQQSDYPLVVKHAEDEIGAINHALGASFAGVRAMTGTSGGGFALMVETVSLAGVSETPLVILEAQRKSPATGLPTWTEQADLSFILSAGHGDIQRVVFTPGTINEHFYSTKTAFYLAEKYQIPVFILSDKFALESHQTMPIPNKEEQVQRQSMVSQPPENGSFLRYQLTENGISPRSIPGQEKGLYICNSYEHDEFGFATEESAMTQKQVEKRAKKVDSLREEIPQPYIVGQQQADLTFVCWGSTINVLQQLIAELNTQPDQAKPAVNAIHIPCVWPFPVETFTQLTNNAQQLIMIEGNQSGQGERLIRQETGITFEKRLRRYDGRPFYVEELREWVKKQNKK